MKKFPKHIRKLQRIFNIPNEAVIEIKVPEGEVRVCDYCNKVLIDGKGGVLKKCHLTDYGLMCDRCLGSIKPLITYLERENVYYEDWYQAGIAPR